MDIIGHTKRSINYIFFAQNLTVSELNVLHGTKKTERAMKKKNKKRDAQKKRSEHEVSFVYMIVFTRYSGVN